MKPLTSSEQALAAYFYTIASDPRVKAAGYSPTKFKDAVFARASQDFVAVSQFMLRGATAMIEPKVALATRNVARTMLGGTVSSRASEVISSGVEVLVKDGFKRLGEAIENWSNKPKRK